MPLKRPYIHDCDDCEWVGWLTGQQYAEDNLANVYVHRNPDGRITVVIRNSDEPSDYWSATTDISQKGFISWEDEDGQN